MGQGKKENIVVYVWPAIHPLQGVRQVWSDLSSPRSENFCRTKERSVSSKMGKSAVGEFIWRKDVDRKSVVVLHNRHPFWK